MGLENLSTVQISEVSKNERVICTHSYRPVLGSYTIIQITEKSAIHKGGSNVQCYILRVQIVPYLSYIDPCASIHSFFCFVQLLSSENEVTLPIHIH